MSFRFPSNEYTSLESSSKKQKDVLHLFDLPRDVFELILRYACEAQNGEVPFENWYLQSVNKRFQKTIISLVQHVDLSTCYQLSRREKRLEGEIDYLQDPAALILSGPLLKCHNLQSLDISRCHNLSDLQIGSFLRRAVPLKRFIGIICRNQTSALVEDLSRKAGTHLVELDLTGCDRSRHGSGLPHEREPTPFHPCSVFNDDSLMHIGNNCEKLRKLTLSKALSITNIGLRHLSRLMYLQDITLKRLTGITDEGISYLSDGNGIIKYLSLLSCGTITDEGLGSIARGRATRKLESISVSFNHQVSNDGLKILGRSLLALEEFKFDHCASITEEWCENINGSISPLKKISLRGINLEFSPTGMKSLTSMFNLVELNLSYVGTINAEVLHVIGAGAPFLRALILEACSKVDDHSAIILSQFEHLEKLDISWCNSITEVGLKEIAFGKLRKSLTRLRIGPLRVDYQTEVLKVITNNCKNLLEIKLDGKIEEQCLNWLRQTTIHSIIYAEVIYNGTRRISSVS